MFEVACYPQLTSSAETKSTKPLSSIASHPLYGKAKHYRGAPSGSTKGDEGTVYLRSRECTPPRANEWAVPFIFALVRKPSERSDGEDERDSTKHSQKNAKVFTALPVRNT